MPSKKILLASAFALASSVNAHMKMLTPIPFGNPTLDNSPLAPSGSDFPCKQRPGVYDTAGAKNPPMAVGAPQTFSLTGGATHGGGSCQISLTSDKNPTKDTKWQVIRSIIGDCPSASDTGANKFQFTIPDGIKPGDYVLAWTWFNRIGNREMYMNCAPITVTAGSKKRSTNADISKRANSFPNMFKANIGNGCTTAEGGNVMFPDPGQSVQKSGTFPSMAPIGSCGTGASASTNSSSAGSGAAPAPVPAAPAAPSASAAASPAPAPSAPAPAAPAAPSAPAAASPAPAPSASNSTAPAAPSAPAAAPPALAPSAPAPAAPAAPSAPAAAPPAPAPSAPVDPVPAAPAAPTAPQAPTPAGVATSNGSCTQPGMSVCSPDGKQIGTCDGTNHVTFIPVAQGTVCQGGYMVMAGSAAPAGKRSAKFRNGPVRYT